MAVNVSKWSIAQSTLCAFHLPTSKEMYAFSACPMRTHKIRMTGDRIKGATG